MPRATLPRTPPVTGGSNLYRLHPSTPRPRAPTYPVSRCLARRLLLAAPTCIGCTLAPLDPQPCTYLAKITQHLLAYTPRATHHVTCS